MILIVTKNSVPFRAWFYFRMGWSTYFAFILAAINTLTVTYFLAIENYPSLKLIFPSFEIYIVIIVTVGIPLLVAIGYAHFKRTQAFKSEIDVQIESNPYQRRNLVNTESILRLNLLLARNLLSEFKSKKEHDEQISELETLIDELKHLIENRTFGNSDDMNYLVDRLGIKK